MFEQRDYSKNENILMSSHPLSSIQIDNHQKNIIVSDVSHSQYTFDGKI
jgi:hypothetical protein